MFLGIKKASYALKFKMVQNPEREVRSFEKKSKINSNLS